MKAFCLIRRGPEYRSDAFHAGLQACGYRVVEGWNDGAPGRDDVLVIWNRYGSGEVAAQIFERAGAHVLVAENGYLGEGSPVRSSYALALRGHNGSGKWYEGAEDRFAALGLDVAEWRGSGGHILVCGQRGIGTPGMASPHNWHYDTAQRLRELTGREIRVRPHPETRGLGVTPPPLEQDLDGCHAVVIWSSGCGLKALLAGVPVFYAAPAWSAAISGRRLHDIFASEGAAIEHPMCDDRARLRALRSVAWQQWSLAEIASGLPLRHLLGRPVSVAA